MFVVRRSPTLCQTHLFGTRIDGDPQVVVVVHVRVRVRGCVLPQRVAEREFLVEQLLESNVLFHEIDDPDTVSVEKSNNVFDIFEQPVGVERVLRRLFHT